MNAPERLLFIEQISADLVVRVVPLELDGESLRLILHLRDGNNLRVIEQWHGQELLRYSYYWLTAENQLMIGWDNAPHHRHVATHPHHKHIGQPTNMQSSQETKLEDVLQSLRVNGGAGARVCC